MYFNLSMSYFILIQMRKRWESELTHDELDSGAVKIIKKKDGSCAMKAEAFLQSL